ncbi:MAG: hypothetical protein LBQ15_11960 [Clostridium sp.]|jgi:ribosomal-protein-alanine N-acetyltransferase|nr:hypothetical protein [Clostridium sp.]
MRRYEDKQSGRLMQVVCNKCGKILRVENGFLKEGCFQVDYSFNYFSKKDGARHRFDLCEDCYDSFAASLTVPAEISVETEML